MRRPRVPEMHAVRRALQLDGRERQLVENYLEARARILSGNARPRGGAELWAGWAIHRAGGAERAAAAWHSLGRHIPASKRDRAKAIVAELVQVISVAQIAARR